MKSQPTVISPSDLHNIHGGHSVSTVIGVAWILLEIPHVIMGIREFTNYIGERLERGRDYDKGDYFTAFFCNHF